MTKLWGTFRGFALWARLLIGLAMVLLVVGLSVRFVSGLRTMIFGDTGQKKAEATEFIWDKDVDNVRKTGKMAQETTIKTYKEHDRINRVVEGGKNEVNRAYKGGQIDPDVDAAGAAALCKLHNDLCRRTPGS